MKLLVFPITTNIGSVTVKTVRNGAEFQTIVSERGQLPECYEAGSKREDAKAAHQEICRMVADSVPA